MLVGVRRAFPPLSSHAGGFKTIPCAGRRAGVIGTVVSNRLLELMRAYRSRPPARAEQSLWEYVAERDPYLFAHHPAGKAFREHVWRIRGLYFCKGCMMTAAGLVLGIVFQATTGWLGALDTAEVAIVFVLLLIPTIISHALDLPRPLKHVSRLLLGVLLISAVFYLFVTDSWLVRGIIVGTYLAVKIPLERRRRTMNRRIGASD